jgi:rhodanese-related sulfurtransferase
MLTTNLPVREAGVADHAARPPDAVLLDVRESEEYAHAHVPGAVNVPQADLATRLAQEPRDRPVILICQTGLRSLRAARFLRQVGFEQVASVAGGTEAWRAAGQPLAYGDVTGEPPRLAETKWTHAGSL